MSDSESNRFLSTFRLIDSDTFVLEREIPFIIIQTVQTLFLLGIKRRMEN